MSFFLDKYLGLKIKTRIYLLCACYSFCIIFGVGAGRSLPLTYSILTTALFVVAGAFFGGLLFWSVNDALQRILGYLKEMTDGNLRQTTLPSATTRSAPLSAPSPPSRPPCRP